MEGLTDHRRLADVADARVHFTLARPEHDEAIRRLLCENPMHGAISVSFEREPSYFAAAVMPAENEVTLLAFVGEHLVAMGRCVTRSCWLNGKVARVGYLSELRLDHAATDRLRILRSGYEFLHQLEMARPADFYFTSIAADNDRARRLLERGVRGLPRYEFLTGYTTLVVDARRAMRSRTASRAHFETATTTHVDQLVTLLNDFSARFQLTSFWTAERLNALAYHGLKLENIQLAFFGDRLVGCAGVWDQRAFRQTVIRDYSTPLKLARPFLNLAARLCGTVRLPSIGAIVDHAFVFPFALTGDADEVLRPLISASARSAVKRGLHLLTLGFSADDPDLQRVRKKFGGRVYSTRFYQVRWPEIQTTSSRAADHVYLPEAALL